MKSKHNQPKPPKPEDLAREDLDAHTPIVFTRTGIRRFDPFRDTEAHGSTMCHHNAGDRIFMYLSETYDCPLWLSDFILDE